MANLAQVFLKLGRADISLLKAIEAGMRKHQWVPLEEIARISGMPIEHAEHRLGLLSKLNLVAGETLHYQGYQIDFPAYDLLAISELVDRNVLACLGERIGVGKESVVYEALGQGPLAIKFHREGRTSFKHVRRVREHLKAGPRSAWIHAARRAAHHEFNIMNRLYPELSIPRPVAWSKHSIAMDLISGVRLDRTQLEDPRECLEMILQQIGLAFRTGIIHADLSEYNVLVDDHGIKIIDWPQAVKTDHPNASGLLRRDMGNILRFFARKYKIQMSLEESLAGINLSCLEVM